MEIISAILISSQLIFTFIAGMYFFQNIRFSNNSKAIFNSDFRDREEKLLKLKSIKLTEPLSEKTRPKSLDDIKGQDDGIKALRSALCSKNPRHVIIYGPPGVGKTAAARLILEEAKLMYSSPFGKFSKFVEIDATTLRFDERSIADPLIGSVHDPIYQGAGIYGNAGIPQPKEGAVTKAHGGILFIDEIGELHPVQMNKLLKVLEDRKVFFSSSYYSEENKAIPRFIHDIFKNGMPADFRLVGATTRKPEEIPPALRSRCTEIFFKSLDHNNIEIIVSDAFKKTGYKFEKDTEKLIADYATNGREAVNIVENAVSIAEIERRSYVSSKDIEWIAETSHKIKNTINKIKETSEKGIVNGLAVTNNGNGTVLGIEISAEISSNGEGSLITTGIAENETIKNYTGTISKKSNILSSIENVITCFENFTGISLKAYNIHINFTDGTVADGPSAGIAIYCGLYSAVFNIPIPTDMIFTGEISIKGNILPVGGVFEKLKAGFEAGAKTAFIPFDNFQSSLEKIDININPVKNISELTKYVFEPNMPNIYSDKAV